MKHSPKKRQIFAMLDHELKPTAKQKLLDHIEKCPDCARYHLRMKNLRAEVREAYPVEAPDWSRIDAAVQDAVREISARPVRRPLPLLPLFLAMGATAAVIALLLLPPQTDNSRPMKPTPKALVFWASLRAQIIDGISPDAPYAVLRAVEESENIETSGDQVVRLGIGGDAVVEIGSDSAVGVLALSEYTPRIELINGNIVLNVPKPCAVEHGGVVVLAAGAEFHVLYGVTELRWEEDGLAIRVISGEVDIPGEQHTEQLAAGNWHYSPAPGDRDRGQGSLISRVDSLATGIPANQAPSSALDEKSVGRFRRGTLPKSVIRKVIAPIIPRLRQCYEQALKRNPQLTLTASLQFTVNEQGRIAKVSAKGIDKQGQLKTCFEEVTKDAHFPPPLEGPVDFILPLRLYPRL